MLGGMEETTITLPFESQVIEIPQDLRGGLYGVEDVGPAANLEFDECKCTGCDRPVAGYLDYNEETGYESARFTTPFMDAEWNLWCEDCVLPDYVPTHRSLDDGSEIMVIGQTGAWVYNENGDLLDDIDLSEWELIPS